MEEQLFWLDCETTGLDAERDYPLELGVIITDLELVEQASWSTPIRDKDIYDLMLLCDPIVFQMHTKNGLFKDVEASGIPSREAEAYVLGLVGTSGMGVIGNPCAGSTPQFDRRFLARHMPLLDKLFNHRVMDVSSFKWWQRVHGVEFPPEKGGHRALPDIRSSIERMRSMRGTTIR